MVQIKFSVAFVLTAVVIAPVVALPAQGANAIDLQARNDLKPRDNSDFEILVARHRDGHGHHHHSEDTNSNEGVQSRSFDDSDFEILVTRTPHKNHRHGKKAKAPPPPPATDSEIDPTQGQAVTA